MLMVVVVVFLFRSFPMKLIVYDLEGQRTNHHIAVQPQHESTALLVLYSFWFTR